MSQSSTKAARYLSRAPVVIAVALSATALMLLALLPNRIWTAYYLRVIVYAMVTSAGAIGLNFAVGVAGQINLGQAVFMGIGAYVLAILTQRLDAPWIPSVIAALLASGVLRAAFGWVAIGFVVPT